MRTTITIAEDLLKEAMRVSGKDGYSEAIVTSLKDYIALKQRLAFLETLFAKQLSHSYKQIKRRRRSRRWSS